MLRPALGLECEVTQTHVGRDTELLKLASYAGLLRPTSEFAILLGTRGPRFSSKCDLRVEVKLASNDLSLVIFGQSTVDNTNSMKKEVSHFSQQEDKEKEAFQTVQDTGDQFNVSIIRSMAISLPVVDILLLIMSKRMPILLKEQMKMWSTLSYY